VPHGLKSAVRWALWRCIRGLLRLYLAAETGDTGRDAIFSENLLAVAFKSKLFFFTVRYSILFSICLPFSCLGVCLLGNNKET